MNDIMNEGVGHPLGHPPAPRKKKFVIKKGAVRIKVYPTHPGWTVSWVTPDGRNRKYQPTEAKAREFASTIGDQLADGVIKVISTEEIASLQRAREILAPWKVSIELAASEYAKILSGLPEGVSVGEVFGYWRSHHAKVKISIHDGVEEFLRVKRQDLDADGRHVADLESRLGKFRDEVPGQLDCLTPERADGWLRGLRKQDGSDLAPQTFNHFRGALLNFFYYARVKRWLSFDPSQWAADYPPRKVVRGKVEVFTPEEAAKLLCACQPKLLPALVLGLFAGLRPSEIMRVNASGLDFEHGAVYDFEGKVRTAGDRIAPLLPVAIAWLKPLKLEGSVCSYASATVLSSSFMRLAETAGVEWKHDGPRHSYVSYRIAITENMEKVSEETGTDVKTLRKHYRRPMKRQIAEAWFNLSPSGVSTASENFQAPAWWKEVGLV